MLTEIMRKLAYHMRKNEWHVISDTLRMFNLEKATPEEIVTYLRFCFPVRAFLNPTYARVLNESKKELRKRELDADIILRGLQGE